MTPAERAVIDAARAWADWTARHLDTYSDLAPTAGDLYAAVRALPRPLSEQLAELRVGDVVVTAFDETGPVVWVHHERRKVWLWNEQRQNVEEFTFAGITRIISNPEADRG